MWVLCYLEEPAAPADEQRVPGEERSRMMASRCGGSEALVSDALFGALHDALRAALSGAISSASQLGAGAPRHSRTALWVDPADGA